MIIQAIKKFNEYHPEYKGMARLCLFDDGSGCFEFSHRVVATVHFDESRGTLLVSETDGRDYGISC